MTDFKLDLTDGDHIYYHPDGRVWQEYDIVDGKPDISEKDPNIKRVKVDNIKEANDKKGGGIIIS